jgi:hypothetical protein
MNVLSFSTWDLDTQWTHEFTMERHDRRSCHPMDLVSLYAAKRLALDHEFDSSTTSLIVGSTKRSTIAEIAQEATETPPIAFDPYALMKSLPNLAPYLIGKYLGLTGLAVQLSCGVDVDISSLIVANSMLRSAKSASVLVVTAHAIGDGFRAVSLLLEGSRRGTGLCDLTFREAEQLRDRAVPANEVFSTCAGAIEAGSSLKFGTRAQNLSFDVDIAA